MPLADDRAPRRVQGHHGDAPTSLFPLPGPTTENAPAGSRGDFWGYYREERTATGRVLERIPAYRAKSNLAESG